MKYQKMFQKLVCFLLVWNLLITYALLVHYEVKTEEKINEQICNLEAIPQYELMEIE